MAAGAAKHLEFPAGGDQRVTVTRVRTIKAQHLNTIIFHSIMMCMIIEVLGGSVGGFYKRFAAPAAIPLPDCWEHQDKEVVLSPGRYCSVSSLTTFWSESLKSFTYISILLFDIFSGRKN